MAHIGTYFESDSQKESPEENETVISQSVAS